MVTPVLDSNNGGGDRNGARVTSGGPLNLTRDLGSLNSSLNSSIPPLKLLWRDLKGSLALIWPGRRQEELHFWIELVCAEAELPLLISHDSPWIELTGLNRVWPIDFAHLQE